MNSVFFSEELSDLRVRKKRTINNSIYGSRGVTIEQVPYIVNIQKYGYSGCAGSILSPNIILTAAHCVHDGFVGIYKILSGSSLRNRGIIHNVRKIIVHPGYHWPFYIDDLALLDIFPPIDINFSPNREIRLHRGLLSPNYFGTLSGWGCTYISP